jgi:hypothetical protein
MGYTSLGNNYAPLPSGTPVHVVHASDPRFPGIAVRHFYEDPTTGSKAVELPQAQNVVLTSGQPTTLGNGAQYWDAASQTSYAYPKVVIEGGVQASGLPGVLYPYLVQ